jgi:3-dehydroquinate synthetase/predicted NBD/HSP70 family sugar kinase
MSEQGRRAEEDELIVTFDVGGTWFRSAVVDSTRQLRDIRRVPAIGHVAMPDASVRELQDQLVDYILGEVAARQSEAASAVPVTVGISIGAATHGDTGVVLASAPLWGPGWRPFDLARELRAAQPAVAWTVLNDVTAAAIALAEQPWAEGIKKLAALTISSGIALRTIDVRTGHIPTDRASGLQGEIGHLPVDMSVAGHRVSLTCECGGRDHLSAFLSGRGLPNLLRALGYAPEAGDPLITFTTAVKANSAGTPDLLDEITRPLARILLDLAVLDPECELVVLHGGLAAALGEPLRASIVRNLAGLGMYGIDPHDLSVFDRRIGLQCGDQLGLAGAARAAKQNKRGPLTRSGLNWYVATQKRVGYAVRLVRGVFDRQNPALADASGSGTTAPRVVVVDNVVAEIYGQLITDYFTTHGIPTHQVMIKPDERTKTIDEVIQLIREYGAAHLPRRDVPVIAIGGGVTLDVVGLSTSLFRRGTPYVRVPTTLIGLIDAGIGAKTAVNVGENKSRIGTYHPASIALLDPAFLNTLDRRQISNGLAEAVKIALVKRGDLFELLEHEGRTVLDGPGSTPVTGSIVSISVDAMLGELADNLWEHRLERLADFGHTFSPVIEMRATPPLLHGEAVSVDMAVSCLIARNRELLSPKDSGRVLRVLEELDLPVFHPNCTVPLLAEALEESTRHRAGRQRVPLLTGIGKATFVNDLVVSELTSVVEELAVRRAGRSLL